MIRKNFRICDSTIAQHRARVAEYRTIPAVRSGIHVPNVSDSSKREKQVVHGLTLWVLKFIQQARGALLGTPVSVSCLQSMTNRSSTEETCDSDNSSHRESKMLRSRRGTAIGEIPRSQMRDEKGRGPGLVHH